MRRPASHRNRCTQSAAFLVSAETAEYIVVKAPDTHRCLIKRRFRRVRHPRRQVGRLAAVKIVFVLTSPFQCGSRASVPASKQANRRFQADQNPITRRNVRRHSARFRHRSQFRFVGSPLVLKMPTMFQVWPRNAVSNHYAAVDLFAGRLADDDFAQAGRNLRPSQSSIQDAIQNRSAQRAQGDMAPVFCRNAALR